MTAFEMGYIAFIKGKAEWGNPFLPEDKNYLLWLEGYQKGLDHAVMGDK